MAGTVKPRLSPDGVRISPRFGGISLYDRAMDRRRLHRWLARGRAWLRFALRAGRLARFMTYTARRFAADGALRQAAGLSYASLLALVPLLAVGLAFLAGFPAFEEWRFALQRFVFENMLPDTGLEISDYMITFIDNASRMKAPGLFGLALTAILLMSNIQGAFNEIWRVAEPRPLALRLIVYWTLLTLGPLFIGASLSISSYAFAAAAWFDSAALGGLLGLARLLSMTLSALGFAVIYLVVPNRSVHPGHAFAGGVVAAILFEALKAAFGLYVRHFPSYQLVYGAISTVPIFLVWMYLSWAVTLFGAEVAAALPEWRAAERRGPGAIGPGARLALALSLLARLRAASRTGERLPERRLGARLPATPAEIDAALRQLRQAGFVERVVGGRWVLCRDLTSATLADLIVALELRLVPGEGWDPAASAAVTALAEAVRGVQEQPIEMLLSSPAGRSGHAVQAIPALRRGS
ncbi:MAG: YihY family inner membrane protein [Alphaproteobacteria bacterium]|nr:MAG: YihY family inner membrane protein [Alphaproteobacteria bacterium]